MLLAMVLIVLALSGVRGSIAYHKYNKHPGKPN